RVLFRSDSFIFALKFGISHQVFVNFSSAFTTFGDRPDNERLTATHIAGHKYFFRGRFVFSFGSIDVSPFVEFHAELLQEAFVLWMQKTHRERDQLTRYLPFGAFDLLEFYWSAQRICLPLQIDCQRGAYMSVVSSNERLGADAPLALTSFFM